MKKAELPGVRIKTMSPNRRSELIYSFLFCFSFLFFSCTNTPEKPETETTQPETVNPKPQTSTPEFNGDSAYALVRKQVDFGPRIPGTQSHAACAAWMTDKLKLLGIKTTVQNGTVTTFDNRKFILQNIIAEYNPQSNNRILLLAHWDTRPWADADSVKKDKPFDGANDGASGAAVLMEIARQLSISKPDIGVDIFLSDLEDYGQEENDMRFPRMEDSWCLGTQYWAKNLHRPNYFAKFGILVDMVGGKDAVFPKEGSSVYYASDIVNKVWNTASEIGYGNYFINGSSGQTTDDHVYVNQLANIKCIDIVHYDLNIRNYPSFHHTHADNMSIIDKNTLKIVGQVVLEVIFREAQSN